MAQMTTVRKIQTHQTLMRYGLSVRAFTTLRLLELTLHDSLIDLQIRRRTTQCLHIDTPLCRVQAESLEGSVLACRLDSIDMLVSTIVASTGISFRVLVGHWGAQCVEDGARCDILGGDEEDGLALALDLETLEVEGLEMRKV
jgi:hypothetical protein